MLVEKSVVSHKSGSNLAPYQPSQRHIVLDERHATADDKRLCKLTRAVVLLEQSRTPEDLARWRLC